MRFVRDVEKNNAGHGSLPLACMHVMMCLLPHCEGTEGTTDSYAINDDMINGEDIFAFDWEHDSTVCIDSQRQWSVFFGGKESPDGI